MCSGGSAGAVHVEAAPGDGRGRSADAAEGRQLDGGRVPDVGGGEADWQREGQPLQRGSGRRAAWRCLIGADERRGARRTKTRRAARQCVVTCASLHTNRPGCAWPGLRGNIGWSLENDGRGVLLTCR